MSWLPHCTRRLTPGIYMILRQSLTIKGLNIRSFSPSSFRFGQSDHIDIAPSPIRNGTKGLSRGYFVGYYLSHQDKCFWTENDIVIIAGLPCDLLRTMYRIVIALEPSRNCIKIRLSASRRKRNVPRANYCGANS